MIIIEMDSDSQAFLVLQAATQDPNIYRLRIALDEGEFKVKFNEGTWTAKLAGVKINAGPGDLNQLLRDIGDIPKRLPYDLEVGDYLVDWPTKDTDSDEGPQGLWRVTTDGLEDLKGGDDWDWEGLISNGGMGTLHKLIVRAA